MSAISLKSITGITSITTPAGVDNQLTLHTNNTTERLKIDVAGNVHVNNHLAVTGVSTFSQVINANNGINLTDTDNKSILLGASDDMRIRHTGSHSEITDEGQGNLRLGGNNIVIGSATFGATMATFAQGGAAKLYHNDTKTFETTNEGATFDTGSSSCVVRLTSNTDAVTILQGFNSDFYLKAPSGGNLILYANGNEDAVKCIPNGAVELYHNGNRQVFTIDGGMNWQDSKKAEFGNSGDLKIYNASNENHIYGSTSQPIIFSTNTDERLRITSTGRVVIGNSTGTQPSATVAGAQFHGGSYPGDFRISSGAGASGTTTASIAIMGSNHNASIENGANSGAHLNLYNYNTTDGNSSGVMFMNSNGLSASRILGLNVSHSSRTGALVFMTSNGSHPTEKLRIDGSGRVIIGATSTIGNTYSNNFTVSEASGNVGMQFAGNNSTSNYASIYFGDAGHRQKHYIETQLGTNGHFTIGTIGIGPIRFSNSNGQQARITTNLVEANSTFGIANVGGSIGGSGGTENWIGIKDSGGNFKFVVKTHSASSGNFGKVGINNTNPTHPLHIVNTSSTYNSASLIKGDTSTSGGGAYATFTNTADSKSAYFGVDGNGLFNVDPGAALVGTNGSEPVIFATNGNNTKVRIFGGTDTCLQLDGGSKLSITDYAPNVSFSGSYAGFHHDNHGNTLLALNASLNYSGTSGTHQWKQNNAHSTIGSAGIFIGGNGSANNSDITFFRNSQGNSAGQVFSQDDWRFKISSIIYQNYGVQYQNRGFFYTNTSGQNATNAPGLANTLSYGFGYQEAYSTSGGTWVHPYPDLVLAYHTGVSLGAYRSYGGCRFFQDHPSGNTSTVLEVGNGSTGVHVTGAFTAGSNKGFRIAHPHPSKKYTHDLVHNAIEAPQMDLIYRGKIDLVNGSATVNIDIKAGMTDGTFVLLNRDIQCFTSNETGWTAVKGSVSGNILTITAQDNSCTDTISWMVVGERQDDKIKESELTTDDGDLITEPLTIEATHM